MEERNQNFILRTENLSISEIYNLKKRTEMNLSKSLFKYTQEGKVEVQKFKLKTCMQSTLKNERLLVEVLLVMKLLVTPIAGEEAQLNFLQIFVIVLHFANFDFMIHFGHQGGKNFPTFLTRMGSKTVRFGDLAV